VYDIDDSDYVEDADVPPITPRRRRGVADKKHRRNEGGGWKVVQVVGGLLLIVGLVIVVGLMLAADKSRSEREAPAPAVMAVGLVLSGVGLLVWCIGRVGVYLHQPGE
jgi:hypothetical protein